jgi:3-oxoacyl-[acyl-carrier protein] reductase
VNNASPSIESFDFAQLSWDIFQKHIDIQVKGAFHLTQAVLPHLLENQNGIIVNISSVYADNVPPVKLMPYSIAKAAIITFTRCLAAEYGHKGIRANCVSPGMTHTDLIINVPEKAKMVTKMQTPLRRLAIPEEIAGTVAFLFSDKAAFITGQNIRVCGGIVMT